MKKFALILDGQIVYKYEADEKQVFGGPWGNATQLEVPEELDIKFIELEDGKIVEDTEAKIAYQLEQQKQEKIKFLQETDWKVIRHIGQKALGLKTSMSEEEYLNLEQQRQSARDSI